MTKNNCAICFQPLPRAQRTCGKFACTQKWKSLNDEQKDHQVMMATLPPSERALLEAQFQAEELVRRQMKAEQFKEQLAIHNEYQAEQDRIGRGAMPEHLAKQFTAPTKADFDKLFRPKGGTTPETDELPTPQGETPSGGD